MNKAEESNIRQIDQVNPYLFKEMKEKKSEHIETNTHTLLVTYTCAYSKT